MKKIAAFGALTLVLTLALTMGAPLVSAIAAPAEQGTAPAYYVAEFHLEDVEKMRPYSAQVASTLEPFGGRFVVRGGQVTPLEGQPAIGRVVVIAFDSLEQAKAWYHSAAYTSLRPLRHSAGQSNTYFIQGSAPQPKT